MLPTFSANDHYQARNIMLRSVKTAPSDERVRFYKLLDALDSMFSDYNSACVEARVRPSIEKTQKAVNLLQKYQVLENDIMTSLVFVKLYS